MAELVADRRVAALDLVITVPVTFGDDTAPLQLLSVEHRKGALPVETVAGRPAAALGEIALQPRTAHRLGVGVGDTVVVRPVKGPPVSLRVTGIVVYRGGVDDPLGEGGVVVRKQLPVLAVGAKQKVNAYVLATPGRAGFLFRELSSRLEVHGTPTPPEIRNLGDLLMLPEVLALVLAVVGGAAVVPRAARRRPPACARPRRARRARRDPGPGAGDVGGRGPGHGAARRARRRAGRARAWRRVVWWEVATSTGVGG